MSTKLAHVEARFGQIMDTVLERRESSVTVGLLAIFSIGVFVDPQRFLTIDNLFLIFRGAASITLIGYGVAILMVTGEFDLSVGSLFALSSGLVAVMINRAGYDPYFAIAIVIAIAIVYGITQGLLVTKLGLPSLIITIGTLTLMRGAHQLLLGGQSETIGSEQSGWVLNALGGTIELPFVFQYRIPFVHTEVQQWGSFSIQIIWMFLLLGVFHYVLFYTRFGYHIRATGDNINSVETTGVDPELLKLACFGITAAMAAFTGIMQLGRIGSVSPNTGSGLALISIAAVVLGGTKLSGGEGSIAGVLMGAVILSLSQNILAIAGFGVGGWQSIITGLFIIAAIGLDTVFKGHSRGLLNHWYGQPLRKLSRSPKDFFRTTAAKKTTDDGIAFLALSITVTAALLWIELTVTRMFLTSLGFRGLSFSLFAASGWSMAAIQMYLVVVMGVIVAFFTIQGLSRYIGGTGDYENTLTILCYGMAPVVLLSLPQVVLGYNIVLLLNAESTALASAVPGLALIAWVMHTGIAELHGVSRSRAAIPVAGVMCVWMIPVALIL